MWPLAQSLSPLWTPPKVAAAANYAATVLADAPIFYWRLGEASGTTAADATGNGHTGAYSPSGGFTLNEPGAIVGDSDTSVLFDGSHGYVEAASNVAFDVPALTLECWAKFTSVPGAGNNPWLFGRGDAATSNGGAFLFFFGSGSEMAIDVKSGSMDISAVNTTTVTDGNWHHIVGTLSGSASGSKITLYVDGVAGTPATTTASFAWEESVVRAAISNNSFWQPFAGYLDEIAWYGTALSPTRIAAHYAAGI